MRIDSAILSNAIITASADNPIVSGSSQVNITQTTGYSTFSSSIQTYTDAKVSALVESAPGTLDTLNELAAALGDDANLSASIATTIGNKLATSTHTAFSSSNASALRAEYVASTSALSASAHTRREQISASLDATIDALDSLGISTDTERGALSSSAHTQREAIKGLATTANNSLSSSTATALRSEYVAGDSALSSSAHTQREAIKGLATSANNSLSSSTATALRAEYVAADGAFLTSASIGATINDNAVKLSGIESGADVTDATNVTAAGAVMDSEVTDLAGIKGVTISTLQVKPSEGAFEDGDKTKLDAIEASATADQTDAEIRAAVEAATDSNVFTDADHSKLNAIEASADVTDTTNVTAAGALMDSELTSISDVKALDQSVIAGASPSFGTANMTDASNKRFMTDAQETKLDSVETNADVTDTTNVTAAGALMDSELTNLAAVKAINQALTTTSSPTFASGLISNDFTINGNLTVQGDTIQANVATLNIEDKNLLIASGAADSAAADGAGITIDGADETLTWDHGNSRFSFSDDLHAAGNITLTGTVDGRDVASDGTKLDGIASNANNYSHPTFNGDDFSVDTGALTGAVVVSDIDINVTTDTNGHVTDANGSVATRTLTLADLGYTGATDANNYVLPTNLAGDDIDIDTTALTGATVISDLDINITTDTSGRVTDANGTVSTRTLTLADLGYTGATDANNITNNNQLTNGAGYITGVTDISGNAGTATTLETARTIAGVSFNGGADISLNNNNITNGAGYTTYSANQGLDNNDNVHFEGLMVGQTSGATANTIRCVGDVVAYYSSDEQFKDNVVQLDGALDKVKQIRGVEFDWNDKQDVYEGHDIGVIAQEVEAVLPELVHYREHNDSKAVDYVKLTAVLIEAVKELSAKVDELSK